MPKTDSKGNPLTRSGKVKGSGNANPVSGKSRYGAEWVGFARFTLTDEWKSEFAAAQYGAAESWSDLERAVAMGYKFTLRYDFDQNCYQASFYCTDSESPNAGKMLSIRAGNPASAMARLTYAHYIILEETWPDVYGPRAYNPDMW